MNADPVFDLSTFDEAFDVNADGTAIVGGALMGDVVPRRRKLQIPPLLAAAEPAQTGVYNPFDFVFEQDYRCITPFDGEEFNTGVCLYEPILWTGSGTAWTAQALPVLSGDEEVGEQYQGEAFAITDNGHYAAGWSGGVEYDEELDVFSGIFPEELHAVRWDSEGGGDWTIHQLDADGLPEVLMGTQALRKTSARAATWRSGGTATRLASTRRPATPTSSSTLTLAMSILTSRRRASRSS